MKPQLTTSKVSHSVHVILICLALILSGVPAAQAKGDGPRDFRNWRIRPINAAPIIEYRAESVDVVMSEDNSPVPFNLGLSAIDPDGSYLIWSIGLPPSYGVVRINGQNEKIEVAYKPAGDYVGQDKFVVVVADKLGATDSIVVNVDILPVSDAPASHDVSITIDENTTASLTAENFPFEDPDNGDSLQSIQITSEPTAGTLYLDANLNATLDDTEQVIQNQVIPIKQVDTLKFTPAGYGTPYATFAFLICDGEVSADYESLFTINVTHANVAPTNTVPGDQTVAPDTDLAGLVFNIADADDNNADNFGFTLTALNGTLTLATLNGLRGSGNSTSALDYQGTLANLNSALNGVVYRGLLGYVGADTILLSSHDQAADNPLTTTSGVIVMVLNPNHAPIILGDSTITVTMSEDSDPTPFTLTLTANDSDADTLTWSLATFPGNGQSIVRGTGNSQVINYRAEGDYFGSDSLVVKVQDDWGGADTATVNVVIEPVADAPQSTDARVSTLVNTTVNVGTAFPYSDVDGDVLSAVRITALPGSGTLYLDTNTNGNIDDGEVVAADQNVLAADLPLLTFKPAADEWGDAYAVIYFLVNDGVLSADYESQLIVDVLGNSLPAPLPNPIDGNILPPIKPDKKSDRSILPSID